MAKLGWWDSSIDCLPQSKGKGNRIFERVDPVGCYLGMVQSLNEAQDSCSRVARSGTRNVDCKRFGI
jgi:hypothetical protein